MLPISAAKALLPNKPAQPQIPNDAAAPRFDELSPDLRYKLLQRRARGGVLFNVGCMLVAAAMLAPVALPQLNSAADDLIAQLRGLKQRADTACRIHQPRLRRAGHRGRGDRRLPRDLWLWIQRYNKPARRR